MTTIGAQGEGPALDATYWRRHPLRHAVRTIVNRAMNLEALVATERAPEDMLVRHLELLTQAAEGFERLWNAGHRR